MSLPFLDGTRALARCHISMFVCFTLASNGQMSSTNLFFSPSDARTQDFISPTRRADRRVLVHDAASDHVAPSASEALTRAHGSRNRAARLLSISRQLLQHILKKSA